MPYFLNYYWYRFWW